MTSYDHYTLVRPAGKGGQVHRGCGYGVFHTFSSKVGPGNKKRSEYAPSVFLSTKSMSIISRWKNNEEILHPQFNDYIEDVSLEERPIDIWREKIKTCKFDCWDCNYCDSVVQSRMKKNDRHFDDDN